VLTFFLSPFLFPLFEYVVVHPHPQDLGFVAAITGSLMGSTIIYTFPALFKVR